MKFRNASGFTLIELLIVVAIIAILASIAVPNFLEAQVRAKTSAAKATLRTLATGLEAYAVDNNSYPYSESNGATIWMPAGGVPRNNLANVRCGGLTSPIAYLSSIPDDPFKHPIDGVLVVAPVYYERAGFGMLEGALLDGLTTFREVLVPADAVGTSRLDGTGADTAVQRDTDTPARWVLFSLGPDLDNHVKQPGGTGHITKSRYHLANRYDPSNGTVSSGNIIRFPGGTNIP